MVFRTQKDLIFVSHLFDQLPAAIFCKDVENDFRFVVWNSFAEKLWGFQRESIIGKTDYDLFPREQADFFRTKDIETTAAGTIDILNEELDTPNGHFYLKTKKIVFKDQDSGKCFLLGISEDITTQTLLERDLENERVRSVYVAKLASLGEITAGIAHEINTPLTTIGLAAEHLLKTNIQNFHPSDFHSSLQLILTAKDKVAETIQALRTYASKDSNITLEPINISEVVKETLALCYEQLTGEGIKVAVDINGHSSQCMGRYTLVMQVLLNLISNSREAVKDCAAKTITIGTAINRQRLVLYVEDTGSGVSDSNIPRLMTPFFTTKKSGTGSGLSLSISKGLVSLMGGELILTSKINPTRFEFSLPQKETTI